MASAWRGVGVSFLLGSLWMLTASPARATDTAAMERRVVERINEIRQQHDLQPLKVHQTLTEIARDYSQAMATQSFFSHSGPEGNNIGDRVRDAGICYRAVGENLAKNFNVAEPVEAAVTGWMNSEGHRKNILTAEFRETGVGIWRDGKTFHFTQVFLRAFPEGIECPPRTAAPGSDQRQHAEPDR